MMGNRSRDYRQDLIRSLKDPEEAIGYLNAALHDADDRVFLVALRDVVEAQLGGMTNAARLTHLNRENLYRMLSENGNPEFKSLGSLLNAMGLELTIRQSSPEDDQKCL